MDGVKENGFLKVREVCELLGISPHTLRYWEKEFSEYLKPLRSPGGHRLYDDHHLHSLFEVQCLLKKKSKGRGGAKLLLNINELEN